MGGWGEDTLGVVCRLACCLFQVPFAAIRLTHAGAEHVTFHGAIEGQDCAHAAFGAVPLAAAYVIPDTASDPHPAHHMQLMGAPGIRFCAAAPIRPMGSDVEGVLYVLDLVPHPTPGAGIRELEDLAALVVREIDRGAELRALAQREGLFRLLAENSTDTLVRGNLDGIRLYISPAVRDLLGYEPEELVGKRAIELVHPDDLPAFGALMRSIREGSIVVAQSEQRQRHKDGSWIWIEASIKMTRDPQTGEPDGYVVSVRDLQRRKQMERRLQHRALHDPLTGLPNRSAFRDRLGEDLAGENGGLALLCLDLDRFKAVNDGFGHRAGDELLMEMARRFRAAAGPQDMVARWGGDEFVLIHHAARGDIIASAERLAEALIATAGRPVALADTHAQVGLSIGIAVAVPGDPDPDRLLHDADQALYRAKKAGRSTFVLATGAAVP
ncbi:diguanylate cyclase domain-containing protein [Aquabacter cavernae]|uniref:diguanylate cyclase domain-containing protein n=1 Tax=Aquabacter cavernae TaxID=2496029 RepID=UPI0013DEA952|nr:diguanylate cyclase [Aquabacter cavernae]